MLYLKSILSAGQKAKKFVSVFLRKALIDSFYTLSRTLWNTTIIEKLNIEHDYVLFLLFSILQRRRCHYRTNLPKRSKISQKKSVARISSIGVLCMAECYSKALLNYLAASNLPEPTYTRHAAHLADVTSALPMPKSKSPLTGGQAA